jgi:hypothetical protein
MDQAYIIGGSAGGVGLFLVLCCYKLCKMFAGGSCIDSRTRVHVELGDEKSAYRFKSDATFHIQIGDQSKLTNGLGLGANANANAGAGTGLPKEAEPTKIDLKPQTNPDENPV